MKEKTKEDRLNDVYAYKERKSKLESQHEYKDLADKALVDPRSFSFYFTFQQAEFIVNMSNSIEKAPFRAIQMGFDAWIASVSDPKKPGYLYVLRKNNKLVVDEYRIRKDYPIK